MSTNYSKKELQLAKASIITGIDRGLLPEKLNWVQSMPPSYKIAARKYTFQTRKRSFMIVQVMFIIWYHARSITSLAYSNCMYSTLEVLLYIGNSNLCSYQTMQLWFIFKKTKRTKILPILVVFATHNNPSHNTTICTRMEAIQAYLVTVVFPTPGGPMSSNDPPSFTKS